MRLPSSLGYLCMLDFVAFWISLKHSREKQRWFIVLIIYQYLEELKTLDMYRKLSFELIEREIGWLASEDFGIKKSYEIARKLHRDF